MVYDVGTVARGDGIADDTAAIQSVIDTAIAQGGGRIYAPYGHYKLTAALRLAMAPTIALTLAGPAFGAAVFDQVNPDADVFQVGANDVYVEQLRVADLALTGGRYGLNVNNALACIVERVRITGAQIGCYFQGQNERHTVRQVQIDNSAQHAIYAGAANGGTVGPYNFPELQKCHFEKIRLANTVGGTALFVTAVGQVSGGTVFSEILTEGNAKGIAEFEHCAGIWLEKFTTENNPDADNCYSILRVAGNSSVYARDLFIGKPAGPNNYKHYLEVYSGALSVRDSCLSMGGPAATKDIYDGDTISLDNCLIGGTDAISFGNPYQRSQATLVNLRDNSGHLIDWAA